MNHVAQLGRRFCSQPLSFHDRVVLVTDTVVDVADPDVCFTNCPDCIRVLETLGSWRPMSDKARMLRGLLWLPRDRTLERIRFDPREGRTRSGDHYDYRSQLVTRKNATRAERAVFEYLMASSKTGWVRTKQPPKHIDDHHTFFPSKYVCLRQGAANYWMKRIKRLLRKGVI